MNPFCVRLNEQASESTYAAAAANVRFAESNLFRAKFLCKEGCSFATQTRCSDISTPAKHILSAMWKSHFEDNRISV